MSVLIIGKGSIEEKVKEEARRRAIDRRNEDVRKGLARAKEAQRGDFKQCDVTAKILKDYRNFKDPNDRKKITDEYYQAQKEGRRR